MHLANCHRSSGDIDAAIAEARNAIEIYEKFKASPEVLESVYTFLGGHLMTAKRHEEAVAAFSHAMDLNREHEGSAEDLDALLLWRVNASLNSRQLNVGFQDIKEMLERNPSDKNPRLWRARFNFEAGDHKTAAAEWLDLLQDSPDDESLLINCIGVFAGNPDDEVRDGRKALELAHRLAALHKDPEWRSQGGLAAAHAELGEFENAIAAAERSLELAPDDEKPGRLHRLEAYRNGRPFRYETINRSG
jgi:tetratricopeptide (TPR) repeat protein